MFVWATPAYLIRETVITHPGVCMDSLLYDRRPDWCILLQVGTWNIGSLSGKGGDVCEELRKRMIDVCCLLEVR